MNLYQYHTNPEKLDLYKNLYKNINSEGSLLFKDESYRLHRNGDLPATIKSNGDLYYYKHGKIHRDGDKPAIILKNGTVFYYKDNNFHRDADKPAIIYPDGRKVWYKNGVNIKEEY